MDKYQNSVCCEFSGMLHKYEHLYDTNYGVIEECEHCHDRQFFAFDVGDTHYLSYHIRQALQLSDSLFLINYPNFKMI